ncbi:hypothetical protein F4818DRAFT_454954 [Hypoxylon cercidicola]|nr:hypothetical protein F4818DRAFT_454954 [Hypoxylon cercidicola]
MFSSIPSFLSLMAAALATPTNVFNSLPSGYTLGNITWMGNITTDGPEVSFTGPSFQDIEAQILQANPSFAWPDRDTNLSASPQKKVDYLTCDLANFWWAKKFRIEDGIDYLKDKTAIFWCNDNDSHLWIDCNLWSEYAQNVVDACTIDDATQNVKGQQFDSDNWNIIVGYSDC